MKLVELSNVQFDEFAKFHPLNSYFQTSKYALAMSAYGYNYDYLGLQDNDGTIKAATLIISKKMAGSIKYGYAPKGFLINYYDAALLKEFLDQLRQYYDEKDYIFVKFNPEIIIGETNKKANFIVNYNGNVRIIDTLKSMNTKRRVELQEFDLIEPKFNAYLKLKQTNLMTIKRSHRKKIRKAAARGMEISVGNEKNMDLFYKFIKGKTAKPAAYYKTIYNTFAKDNSVDLLFVKIDFEKYLTYVKKAYEKEEEKNYFLNQQITIKPGNAAITNKINSDRQLQSLKAEIIYATNCLKKEQFAVIAGALVIKQGNRISLVASGYSQDYKKMNPNHFLYYAIIERYRNYFDYFDLSGVSGIYDDTSNYQGLNDFKMAFNPTIYEFIGEFDLICDEKIFKRLIKTSFVEDEFAKYRY